MFGNFKKRIVAKALRAVNEATTKAMDLLVPVDEIPRSSQNNIHSDGPITGDNTLNVNEMLKEPFVCTDNYSKKLETGEWVDSTGNVVDVSTTAASEEAKLKEKINELETVILSDKAKKIGFSPSATLDKQTFVITTSDGVKEGNERELMQSLVETHQAGKNPSFLDITPSIQVWAKIVQKSAGNKMVIWSPGSVMNKITFSDPNQKTGGRINERVFIEIESARSFTEDDFLPAGFKTLKGDVSSINVDDALNPHKTVATETKEDKDFDVISFQNPQELLATAKETLERFKEIKLTEEQKSYAEALADALEDTYRKKRGEIITEEEVKVSIPSSAEEAKIRAEMLKRFADDAASVGETKCGVEARCPKGCKCGLDKNCPSCK